MSAVIRIDLSCPPFVPEGWEVELHKPGVHGKPAIVWRPHEVRLVSDCVACGEVPTGRGLFEHYSKNDDTLNANVLDFLLVNPDQIPSSWAQDPAGIFFWGTVYKKPDGTSAVRCLRIVDGIWTSDHCYFA